MLGQTEKPRTAGALIWDYLVKPQKIVDVSEGGCERVAGLKWDAAFRRMLAALPWHMIVGMTRIDGSRGMLVHTNIAKFCSPGLREHYERIPNVPWEEPLSLGGRSAAEDCERSGKPW